MSYKALGRHASSGSLYDINLSFSLIILYKEKNILKAENNAPCLQGSKRNFSPGL